MKPKPLLIAPEPSLPGTAAAIGIDVSKLYFNACFLTDKAATAQRGRFSADSAGQARFITWVQRVGQGRSVHVCLEETGCYGHALAAFLHQAGHHVSLVNAALIKKHAESLNVRNKNDTADAWMIAVYTLERVPARWQPLACAHQKLRDLARRRNQVLDMIVAEKNHLEAAADGQVREHIKHLMDLLQKEHDALWQQMLAVVRGDAAMAHNAQLLKSIPGIGEITAVMLLAELPALDSFESARQLCAYAGLSPRQHQSGSSVRGKTRLCKQGRGGLRTLLFMPAVSLMSSKRGVMRVFADRLLKAGKAAKCVVGALMRKLMALVFAIIRSGTPFDPNYQHGSQLQTSNSIA